MSDHTLNQNIFTSSDTPATITASSNIPHPRRRIVQNYLLIWIDADIDQSNKDYQNTLAELQRVVNDVNIFTELDKCVDYLNSIKDVKAFLIADSIFGQQIISLIHDIPQLDAIWILCRNKSQREEWTRKWPRIKGVYTEIKPICKALQLAAKQCNNDSIAMSFISVDEVASNENLNQLEPSFMYTRIFKEMFLEMKYDTQAIKNLAGYWRELYNGNSNQLKIINEFERSYRSERSIWWYTRACFTYEILNRALRNLEGDTIINMGFFIHDLHRQIEELHKEQVSSYCGKPFVVYRGQGLLTVAYEKLRKTRGGLLSFNNFLSTSKSREVSLVFAEGTLGKADTVGILFQITIDPSVTSTPFADIQSVSYFEIEEEILFSMHTVFRIGEITKLDDDNPLYQVALRLTADDDEQLRILAERIQKEIAGPTGWERMGKLLLNIGQFDKAEELYKVLLEQTSHHDRKAHYYNQLGYVKDDQGDYKEAIRYYEQGLEIKQKTLSSDDPLLATSYNNIGATYRNMGEQSEALLFYEKALEIRKKVFPLDHPDMAQSYNNIGAVYDNMGEYSNALSFYEKALEIRQKVLPSNHPDMAQTYNNIGTTYDNMGEYSDALSFYKKAREIFEKTLPPNHPVLATSCNNIGEVYRNMREYSEALSSHEKVLEIRQKVLSSNHPDMAQSYNNIGATYNDMEEYSNALSFYEKTREIFEEILAPNHPFLALCYNSIGGIYRNMEEYSTALSFSEKALGILERTVLPNPCFVAASYNNIGLVYHKMDEYSKALLYLDDALDILQPLLPSNHPRLQRVRKSIEMVKNSMK